MEVSEEEAAREVYEELCSDAPLTLGRFLRWDEVRQGTQLLAES